MHRRNISSLPALIWKNITFLFSAERADERYDKRLGIDTAGYIESSEIGVSAVTGEPIQPYGPTPPDIAKFLIEQIAERARGFTFIDIGSGKGRILLIAAEFSFCKIIGIEYSPDLSEIAANNVRSFSAGRPGLTPIELATGDATQIPLPDGPLVLYLYNSLGPKALQDFMQMVKAEYLRSPRKIICIYYNAAHPTAFEKAGIFPIIRPIEYPRDNCDRYSDLNFQARVYETADPL